MSLNDWQYSAGVSGTGRLFLQGVLVRISRGTQAPNFVEDSLQRTYRAEKTPRGPKKDRTTRLEQLTTLQSKIDKYRRDLRKYQKEREKVKGHEVRFHREHYEFHEKVLSENLRVTEQKFWELNVPDDPDLRAKLQLEDALAYKVQFDQGELKCF